MSLVVNQPEAERTDYHTRIMTSARVCVAVSVLAIGSAVVPGAAAQTAIIEGAVRDATGFTLPGVCAGAARRGR